MTTVADWTALDDDPDSVARRAAGRRKYNAHRHAVALDRQNRVLRILRDEYGGWPSHGTYTAIARRFNVSRATIRRDCRLVCHLPELRRRKGNRHE